jgi:WD40 repeat protein
MFDGAGDASLLATLQKHQGSVRNSKSCFTCSTLCQGPYSTGCRFTDAMMLPYCQVRGLMFNPFSANLLASGAADGELCIWDLEDPTQPSLYPSLKVSFLGEKTAYPGYVSKVHRSYAVESPQEWG